MGYGKGTAGDGAKTLGNTRGTEGDGGQGADLNPAQAAFNLFLKPLRRARPKRARCGGPNVAYAWQTSRAPRAATAVSCEERSSAACDSARRAPRSEAKQRSCAACASAAQRKGLYKIQMLVYFLYYGFWRSGYMVIGLLVLASVVAIAFDDDVAAAGLLAAAVLVSVGGF
jgi:hypothetical protein